MRMLLQVCELVHTHGPGTVADILTLGVWEPRDREPAPFSRGTQLHYGWRGSAPAPSFDRFESVESNGASSPASSSSSGVVFSVGNGCSGWNADPKDGFSWNAVVHGLKQAVFVLVSASALVVTAPSSGDVLWLPSSDDSVSPSGVCVLTERVSPGPPTSETAPAPWNRSANGARWPSGVPREYCAQIDQGTQLQIIECKNGFAPPDNTYHLQLGPAAVLLARIEDQLLNLLVQTLDRVAHRPSVGVVTSVRVMTGDDEVDDGDGPITTSAVVWEEDGPAESMPPPPPRARSRNDSSVWVALSSWSRVGVTRLQAGAGRR
uniref:Uncharacterized protein n=1 Tax=Anopheles coluzzii TaxID=1518534 RepID=A0A8W7Q1X6_ANOCL